MLLRATSIEKDNLEIRYHLAQALVRVGDKVRAREELKVIMTSKARFPQIDEARALLASLGP